MKNKFLNKNDSSSGFVGSGYGLDPNYVSGFSDGEATFSVRLVKNNKLKTSWSVQPSFSIGLHAKDLALLNRIQSFFGVGKISIRKSDGSVHYNVASLKDLINVIIPHFNKYPLITQKQADFLLFKSIIDLINNKEHLTPEGIQKIVTILASMNKGLTKELKTAFPEARPVTRPIVEPAKTMDPN
jgi:hypothetical protein